MSFDDDAGQTIFTAVKAEVDAGNMTGLPGGDGDDVIDGGAGSDDLFGMGGTNTFAFELNDATSGSDIDVIHDWSAGTANLINIQVAGESIDETSVNLLIASQVADVGDRSFTVSDGTNAMGITVKNIGRDLVLGDFVAGTASATAEAVWYADTDGDTFGDPLVSQTTFPQPVGYVSDNTDCDDTEAAAYPGNTEIFDLIDNDCDGEIDEGVTPTVDDIVDAASSSSGGCFIQSLLD